MPKYKKNYITADHFELLQKIGVDYEGFVEGVGYVYNIYLAFTPPHMDISVPLRYAPPGMDQFINIRVQCLDNSREAVARSYNITSDDIASKIIRTDNGLGTQTIDLGFNNKITLPINNSSINITVNDNSTEQTVSITATNTITGDSYNAQYNWNEIPYAYDNIFSPENISSEVGDYLQIGIYSVNAGVGALSTYMVKKGGYYKWNEVWHQTKTAGTAWRWQSRWNRGASAFHRTNQIKTVAAARNVSTKLTKIGGVLLIADVFLSGEIKPSHAINAAMLGISTTGVGTIVAGIWFIADFGTMGVNYIINGQAKGISDIIDESVGTYEMYEGMY